MEIGEYGANYVRDGEVKCGALAQFRLHPDSSAALLDDTLADRQTDARAGELAAVQPFEDAEDLLMIARIDPDAVVPNGKLDGVAGVAGGNVNLGRLRPAKRDRVRDQLAEELCQLRKIE